jgi:predicted metal-dependent HD superfamily phosphohydrolase
MIDKKRWQEIWQRLDARVAPQAVFEKLVDAYSSPDRFYHNLAHIEDCLSIFDETKSLALHPEEVELTIWFHDAVYDTRRNDNEQKSAEWANAVMIQSGVRNVIAERVSYSILATRHNTEMTDTDSQLMADVDLSILGREPDFFWQYEENIRKEYAWVSESLFREKRIEVLQSFLDRQYIYYHQIYRNRFEEKARVNIEQAILKLRDIRNSI